jgi:hypothetical protein
MIATTHSNRVSHEVLRRRRAVVGGALVVMVVLVGAASGAALTARLFDVGAALAALIGAMALVHELRRPSLERSGGSARAGATRARPRVATVRRATGVTALADVA